MGVADLAPELKADMSETKLLVIPTPNLFLQLLPFQGKASLPSRCLSQRPEPPVDSALPSLLYTQVHWEIWGLYIDPASDHFSHLRWQGATWSSSGASSLVLSAPKV